MQTATIKGVSVQCYHCGEDCITKDISLGDEIFCCQGCKLVYQLLNQKGLSEYYALNRNPGISQKIKVRNDKFAFLDDKNIEAKLINFSNDHQVHVTLSLPQIHCSSCLYLLENLHRIEPGIISCKINFSAKQASIVFSPQQSSLRKVAEVITRIGYEPYISLHDLTQQKPVADKEMIYRIGIAGFCFGNIMLMSFPEYLGIDASEATLRGLFRWLNLLLSLPVFFYAAFPFYKSSWKSLRHRFLNIDAPIALAIIITFTRSAWEVLSGTGGGYFDSMTGIVFFMLAGRFLQEKTYKQLTFDRDYTSYFPVAVSVLKQNKEIATALPEIKPGDTLLIHNEELIPADGILTKGKAYIDYSFVTGESLPVLKETGELLYAGGKQTGSNIEILVVKEVVQSYLTSLWSARQLEDKKEMPISFIHLLGRYFTYIVFAVAIVTAAYWYFQDQHIILPAVTSVFIIACPCALLLSNTFTNGSILRIFSRNKFYLRNAQTIEDIAKINHIVFDKTGTLTSPINQSIKYEGKPLSPIQKKQVASLAACSVHPLSRILARQFSLGNDLPVESYKEIPGLGIEAVIAGNRIKIGSCVFVTGNIKFHKETVVYISFDNQLAGWVSFSNDLRKDVYGLIKKLKKRYKLSVLTGDNDSEKTALQKLFGNNTVIKFYQQPQSKFSYIKHLQKSNDNVMMIGDGLNDAGALLQSDVGIALTEDSNNFTPASDAILSAGSLEKLLKFMRLCKANQRIVKVSFVISILYNLAGIYFAVQGKLSPMLAAILMPSSSLCIFLVTFGFSNLIARRMKL